MFHISGYSVELIKDPFGILNGQRYELKLEIEVPEEDELYAENGVYVRIIYKVEGDEGGIVKYELYEKQTNTYLDFELDDEELDLINRFCKEHYKITEGMQP